MSCTDLSQDRIALCPLLHTISCHHSWSSPSHLHHSIGHLCRDMHCFSFADFSLKEHEDVIRLVFQHSRCVCAVYGNRMCSLLCVSIAFISLVIQIVSQSYQLLKLEALGERSSLTQHQEKLGQKWTPINANYLFTLFIYIHHDHAHAKCLCEGIHPLLLYRFIVECFLSMGRLTFFMNSTHNGFQRTSSNSTWTAFWKRKI